MDLNLITDPELAPRPRDQIQITGLTVTPYSDGRRLKVEIALTPFAPADRPSLEIVAGRVGGPPLVSASVIESMHRAISLTLHLRGDADAGEYMVQADLYYDPQQIQHTLTAVTQLPGSAQPEE